MARDGLRAQKSPPPGVRPGSLVDPGPQRSDRTVRRSSGKDPLLVVASLADASADGVDAATLSFLTASALEARRKEEEERRKQEEQEFLNSLSAVPAERTPQQNRRLTDILLHRAKRKRKKRKKRKLPRAPRPRCGRPCDHRQVPALQVVHVREGAPASVHRQSGGHSCYACRDVYPQCELCSSSCAVPLPDIGDVGFGSSPYLDTKHTIYELCLPSERGCPYSAAPMCCGGICVAMSCGGGGFSPDGAYDSAWYSVRPRTGKYFVNYFQYQGFVECICILNSGSVATTRFAPTITSTSGSCCRHVSQYEVGVVSVRRHDHQGRPWYRGSVAQGCASASVLHPNWQRTTHHLCVVPAF